MKKVNVTTVSLKILAAFLFLLSTNVAFAQANERLKKKIIISTKITDNNGNEQIEKIIKKGADAESINLDELIARTQQDEFVDVIVEEADNLTARRGDLVGDIEIEEYVAPMARRYNVEPTFEESDKAFLGVFCSMPSEKGVSIVSVIKNSGASKAGLLGNDVITHINEAKVHSHAELVAVLQNYKAGDEVTVRFLRNTSAQQVQATLTSPIINNRHSNYGFSRCTTPSRTIEVPQKPQLGVYIDDNARGVLVTELIENSAAQKAGLVENDIIYKVDNNDVTTANQLIDLMKEYSVGDEIKVRLYRADKKEKFNVVLGAAPVKDWKIGGCGLQSQPKEQYQLRRRVILIDKEPELDINALTESLVEENINTELEFKRFELFPNPTNGLLTVKFSTSNEMPLRVAILDVAGKEIFSEDVVQSTMVYERQIDLTSNTPGIYILKITQDKKVFTEKIIYSNQD